MVAENLTTIDLFEGFKGVETYMAFENWTMMQWGLAGFISILIWKLLGNMSRRRTYDEEDDDREDDDTEDESVTEDNSKRFSSMFDHLDGVGSEIVGEEEDDEEDPVEEEPKLGTMSAEVKEEKKQENPIEKDKDLGTSGSEEEQPYIGSICEEL